jgi:hypothetical protein
MFHKQGFESKPNKKRASGGDLFRHRYAINFDESGQDLDQSGHKNTHLKLILSFQMG